MMDSFWDTSARTFDPDALWKVVHDQCVPDQQKNGNPSPCTKVDINQGVEKGSAVLKDLKGDTHFLLIPTAPVSGIESPSILLPDAPPYFQDAWQARDNVEKLKPGITRDDIGLAINSKFSRSQQQLHIHIDCLRPEVHDALAQHINDIGDSWKLLDVPLNGHRYMAMKVTGAELEQNPFKLLADGVPGARENMAAQTLVVAGETFADGKPGFILLADHFDPNTNDRAHGQDLLDTECVIANRNKQAVQQSFELPHLRLDK